ncbi:MAG: Mfa1 fimbrilin C-terminal domain-containing protein, partial [Alistipes sp.]|nr:Mfa1 fimbrilin C-terminal domain-containing protein [Alistipes sp.]
DTKNWYSFDGNNYTPVADVNGELAKIEPAKVWKNGQAYYYTDVKHLGSEGTVGEYGIVRNHSYKVNVSAVKGWGTPVYDPNYSVDPIKPTDKETYIAAEINVLSWRVVSNDAVLE